MSFDINDYRTDFDYLSELKTYLIDYIRRDFQHADKDMLKRGIYSTLHDGRSVRIVIPHECNVSENISLDDDLYFLGFIGYAKPLNQISETTRNEVLDIDSALISKFSDFADILAYISAERIKGGDWSNLVLLRNEETILSWRDSSAHQLARKYAHICTSNISFTKLSAIALSHTCFIVEKFEVTGKNLRLLARE